MPEVKNLDDIGAFLNPVVNEDWRMNQLANAGSTCHGAADIRKGPQQADMVQKGIAEPFSGGRKVDPGIFEDALEIS